MSISPTIPPPPNPRQLLAEMGLAAKKSWGQNFLCDQKLLANIALATGADATHPVIELGAGLGALTYHLLLRGALVVAVERDRDLIPVLERELGKVGNLQVMAADAGRLDYAALAAQYGTPLTVAGNLPYQLSSRIIVSLADASQYVGLAVVLVQREVAERLAAPAGSRTYGLLSVLVQRTFDVQIIHHVAAGAFHPPPKVQSAVVRLIRHDRRLPEDQDAHMVAVARAAFSSRRKTLRNSLSGALKQPPDVIEQAILKAGLSPQARAETLNLSDFARLAEALSATKPQA